MASDLVHNEKVKLTAGAFDRASTACLTVGFIAPVAATVFNIGGAAFQLGSVVGLLVWLLAAAVLHWTARVILGGLGS